MSHVENASNTQSTPNYPSIKLVTLGSAFGMRNVSPFCLKIEMLLTSLGIPFTEGVEADPRKAPKGKLPFLEVDEERLADSELITQFLDEITAGGVYAGLSAKERAYGTALARLAEDHLYWLMVASRWLDDAWFPHVVDGFFHIAPAFIRPLIANGARKQVRKTFELHGLGKHSFAEQQDFARRDLQALQDAVGDSSFLFGETPNIFDFTVTSVLTGYIDNQPSTWLSELGQAYPALNDYAERVQAHVGVFARK